MKGIYITEEAKKELEAKIAELESKASHYESINCRHRRGGALAQIFTIQEILELATVLPVENGYNEFYYNSNEYPQGVIIKPKQ
jgi:hypothetical protein